MAHGYVTLTKDYNKPFYTSGWFYGITMAVKINSLMVENYQENPDVQRIDEPKGKLNWYLGFESSIIELLQVNSAITITGSIDNPSCNHQWETTTLNGDINSTDTSIVLIDSSSFPSQGMIRINDEFIYYLGNAANTLTECQRGFHDTTAATHLTTDVVTNKTDGAECYFAVLDFIKKHGGVLNLTWRNRTISVYMNKFNITDTKREHDGASQDPTSYEVQINCFEASLQ